jgi:hypothetical protein
MELSKKDIENRIFTVRGVQVMVDKDLAELYMVETKVLNQAVKRNLDRFPDEFRFQLSDEESNELDVTLERYSLRSQSVTSNRRGGRRYNPYVFTEQGVAMLSAVLRSDIAVQVSIQIIKAFVTMRKFLLNNASVFQRLDQLELKQLKTDVNLEQIFKALEASKHEPTQGIFFDGQIFDAYAFMSSIVKKAEKEIILIDNYIDESTLTLLSKKNQNIKVRLLTKNISKQLQLDVKKANEQYGAFEIQTFEKSHDRFLIIDGMTIYHIGASLKDLGKKWFAFTKMDNNSVENILGAIENR